MPVYCFKQAFFVAINTVTLRLLFKILHERSFTT